MDLLEDFEEWFAVCIDGCDDDPIAGRLKFSIQDGISLDSIYFMDGWIDSPDGKFVKETLKGYLDYQYPTTLINTRVQSDSLPRLCINTPRMRSKVQVAADAVLKNIHLNDINEKCFTGISVSMPSFNAWYAPRLVENKSNIFDKETATPVLIQASQPETEMFALADETKVEVRSATSLELSINQSIVKQGTCLKHTFPEAVDLKTATKRARHINTLFSFVVGQKMAATPYTLHSTHMRTWNNKEEAIDAQYLFRPVFKHDVHDLHEHEALFTRHNGNVGVEQLMDAVVKEQSKTFFYLMNVVLEVEQPKKGVVDTFINLLGCIEEFDINTFGRGASSKSPNRLTLEKRLDRLQEDWRTHGFKGKLPSEKIVKIRNDIAHGRTANLGDDFPQNIVDLRFLLCAIVRFHIFQKLGFSVEEIKQAFGRKANMFGAFV